MAVLQDEVSWSLLRVAASSARAANRSGTNPGLTQIESALLPDTLELDDFKEKEGAAAMRSTAIQYVGIDVHQATLVCAVKDESGRTIIESKVATERRAITAFLRGLPGRLRVAFEEGTQAQWLHDLIGPLAEEVLVCDPRRIATKGNKADRIDQRADRGVVAAGSAGTGVSPRQRDAGTQRDRAAL